MSSKLTAWNRLKNTVLTTGQIRNVDQLAIKQYGMHSLVLMENAALGCTQWICRRFSSPMSTVILCGRGNNGGDGLVIARHLQVQGWPVHAIVWGPEQKLSADARANLDILKVGNSIGLSICEECDDASLRLLNSAELVVDAMLGTGATGDPRQPLAGWIKRANELDAFRLAIDIPTGVEADSGEVFSPAFKANATLSFVALKPAMVSARTQQLFGEIDVIPIGIPNSLIARVADEAASISTPDRLD